MAKQSTDEPRRMSPLARRLQAVQRNGLSYREMERVVAKQDIKFTSSSFEQVAKDQRADRLTADAVRAVAIILEVSPEMVASWDDERHGILRHVARRATAQDVNLEEVSTEELLAEVAKRAGAANPDAR